MIAGVAAGLLLAALAWWRSRHDGLLAWRLFGLLLGMTAGLVLFVVWTLASLLANRLGGGLQL